MTIAVTGATGQLGRQVIQQLKEKSNSGDDIIGIARSAGKAADLGIPVREADYDHQDKLEQALTGVDRLLLISGSEVGKRIAQHRQVIEAAKTAGVQWIIYTSILRADQSTISLAEEHLATEAMIKASGIAYTFLRNSWYTENYTGAIPGALAAKALFGSAGNGKIASAARRDYAEAAAIVICDEKYKGQTLELAGDTAYTLSELAAELSKQTGKDIPYTDLEEADYAAALLEFGIPEMFAKGLASWDVAASKGDLYDDSKTLSAIIGRPTTPLAAMVTEALINN